MYCRKGFSKRSLIASALALLLCVFMFVGASYAWFADSLSSGTSRIAGKNLEVDLLMDTGKNGNYTSIAAGSGNIFAIGLDANDTNATLWEPNKTQTAYLAIRNTGALDLKYQVRLNVSNITQNMNTIMKYKIVPDAQYNTLAPDNWAVSAQEHTVENGIQVVSETAAGVQGVQLGHGDTHYFALMVHMDDQVSDSYQQGEIAFDLQVLATQVTAEATDFDFNFAPTYPTQGEGSGTVKLTGEATEDVDMTGTGVLKSAKIPADAANARYNAMKDGDAESNELTLMLNVDDIGNVTPDNDTITIKNLEISMTAVMASTTGGATSNVTQNVASFAPGNVTVCCKLAEHLNIGSVTHKGEPMLCSTDPADNTESGVYSSDPETGELTIRAQSLSPFAVRYLTPNVIPKGGTYYTYTGVSSTTLGDYAGDGQAATLGNGTNPFTQTVSAGDVFVYGDYEYRYCRSYNYSEKTGSWINVIPVQNVEPGWGVRVRDGAKTSYEAPLAYIAGKPVTCFAYTYYGCTSLTTLPQLPATAVNLEQTFAGCTNLTGFTDEKPYEIPATVQSMNRMFSGCTALTGSIRILGTPTDVTGCFTECAPNAQHPITVKVINTDIKSAIESVGGVSGNITVSLPDPAP